MSRRAMIQSVALLAIAAGALAGTGEDPLDRLLEQPDAFAPPTPRAKSTPRIPERDPFQFAPDTPPMHATETPRPPDDGDPTDVDPIDLDPTDDDPVDLDPADDDPSDDDPADDDPFDLDPVDVDPLDLDPFDIDDPDSGGPEIRIPKASPGGIEAELRRRRVAAVLVAEDGGLALIDGTVHRIGDALPSVAAKVRAITRRGVVVADGGGKPFEMLLAPADDAAEDVDLAREPGAAMAPPPPRNAFDDASSYAIELRDAPLADALALILARANANFVVPTAMRGTITASLPHVTLDQALDVVLERAGARVVDVRGVLVVRPIEPPRLVARVLRAASAELAPLVASVERLARDDGGMAALNADANELYVVASPARLAMIEELVAAMDAPPAAIEIDVRVIETAADGSEVERAARRLVVADHDAAKVDLLERVPYVAPPAVVGFESVGVRLEVTPTLGVDGRIALVVEVEARDVDDVTPAGPVIAESRTASRVVAEDGATIVLDAATTAMARRVLLTARRASPVDAPPPDHER